MTAIYNPQAQIYFIFPAIYLSDRIYFLLTRRPFLSDKSGLLIETPSQTLDLADYPQENRLDIQGYIRQNLTPLTPLPYVRAACRRQVRGKPEQIYSPLLAGEGLGEGSIQSWLNQHHISEQDFYNRLTTESENNFMYASQILTAIAEGFYPEPFPHHQLPPSLETYYQQHLQQMLPEPIADFRLAVLGVLAQQASITVEAIANTINADEYDVEELLDNWVEFLQKQQIAGETHYSLYHSRFRQWCQNKL